ncbi:MAG TPA: citrate transporter [Chlorobaculum parvum]|uniref:Citrate transporter n=1 Tax=Chlorobaculum parvum TaxID=274539 RepID=A0A7C5HHW8_9CHLB|nr:citrate transporter [Chlorobaculum parvum]
MKFLNHPSSLFLLFACAFASAFVPGSELFAAAQSAAHTHAPAAHGNLPPVWLVAPFAVLLLMIATGPLFYHRFWERHYPKVTVILGLIVATYYWLFIHHGTHALNHALQEYISFIALVGSLFIVSGGILIKIDRPGTPVVNVLILIFGEIISNFIGTTGASMLLIRPYLRINEGRLKPFHIVFFIFVVSNIGGALSPIGDPPLFLGFLKGVPFFWVISKVFLPWFISLALLLLVFFILDSRVKESAKKIENASGGISVTGRRSFGFLLIVIISVFLDPAVIDGFPSLQQLYGVPFGIRELIMGAVSIVAYKTANQKALAGNEFNFEPIREVAFLFIGIFMTMIPALALIEGYAATHAAELSLTRIYWLTGMLSGVLDNAPTYLNFLAGAMGKFGLNIGVVSDVALFAAGTNSPVTGDATSDLYLMAISVASVFFGAMTYLGNAPNFMIKNIAAQTEAEVPNFIEYVYKYSIPILVPIFTLIWFLFFNH